MKIVKVKRFLISGALLTSMVFSGVSANAFINAPPSWSSEAIKNLEKEEILTNADTVGRTSSNPITRGEFCQMLVNLIQNQMNSKQLKQYKPQSANYFVDISNTVNSSNLGGLYDMYYAVTYGITEGTIKNGQRNADCKALLTREQAAKMMCSAINFIEQNITYTQIMERSTVKTFADNSKISSWAKPFVDLASSLGIMIGDEYNKFNPIGEITWNETAVIVNRILLASSSAKNK